MSRQTSVRIATLTFSGFGALAGLIGAALILLPMSQCLIDSADEDVVLWTILYFKWAAGALCLLCSAVGAAVGGAMGKALESHDPTKSSTHS
jgi:hypothetical protein